MNEGLQGDKIDSAIETKTGLVAALLIAGGHSFLNDTLYQTKRRNSGSFAGQNYQ